MMPEAQAPFACGVHLALTLTPAHLQPCAVLPRQSGMTPLHLAAYWCHTHVAQLLLDRCTAAGPGAQVRPCTALLQGCDILTRVQRDANGSRAQGSWRCSPQGPLPYAPKPAAHIIDFMGAA